MLKVEIAAPCVATKEGVMMFLAIGLLAVVVAFVTAGFLASIGVPRGTRHRIRLAARR